MSLVPATLRTVPVHRAVGTALRTNAATGAVPDTRGREHMHEDRAAAPRWDAGTMTAEDRAAEDLLEKFGELVAAEGRPMWLEVRLDLGGLAGIRLVDDPDGFLGRRLSPGWSAAAVVATGRFRVLEPGHEPPADVVAGLAGGLTMVCLVSRQHRVGWRLRLPDGSFHSACPEEGVVLDILRRAAGAPTPPPPVSAVPLHLAAWAGMVQLAADLQEQGEIPRHLLTWSEVLALHPALVPSMSPVGFDCPAAESAVRRSAGEADWEALRLQAAAGPGDSPGRIPPEWASWMDAGMFARWTLAGLPSTSQLMHGVARHLTSDAWRRWRSLMHELDPRRRAAA